MSDDIRTLLISVRDALRRLDPAWCSLHNVEQVTDEELDEAIGSLEELLGDCK